MLTSRDQKPQCDTGFGCHVRNFCVVRETLFLALFSFVIFFLSECSHYFMAVDMKLMLEIKQIGTFFLVAENVVKMSPLSGKERTQNYRKKITQRKVRRSL